MILTITIILIIYILYSFLVWTLIEMSVGEIELNIAKKKCDRSLKQLLVTLEDFAEHNKRIASRLKHIRIK